MSNLLQPLKEYAESNMQKRVDHFVEELSKLRTGRAHPSVLERNVMVNVYGSEVPLQQVARVVAEDARTLAILPFDKNQTQAICAGVEKSQLGLNPASQGDAIRVILPPLTQERRMEMVKHVRASAEQARVAVRNVRRDVLQDLKKLFKDKSITEDEDKRFQTQVQDILNRFVAQIDEKTKNKEDDFATV